MLSINEFQFFRVIIWMDPSKCLGVYMTDLVCAQFKELIATKIVTKPNR